VEKDTLSEIARQTTVDPKLMFETDEAADAFDPEVSRFDLGSDPLGFAEKQVKLGHELWQRAQTQELPEGTPYQELTRAFASGLSKVSGAVRLMNRYVGGVTLRRDHAGTGHATHEVIPAEKQRAAVEMITDTMFKPDSFQFKPEFVSRLAKDRFDTWGDQNVDVGEKVLNVQARALRALLDDDIAERLIHNPEKVAEGTPVYRLSELYQTVQPTIWSELPDKAEKSPGRRDLQREYLKTVLPILSPESKSPGEARSMMRYLTNQLKGQIDAALKDEMSLERRAHLEDCSQTLGRALNPE